MATESILITEENTALVIFCKRPKFGQGKQRIAATLGAENTVQIADALVACAVEDAQCWSGPVFVAVTSTEDIPWAQAMFPDKCHVVAQGPGNLGDKIMGIDQTVREFNNQSCIFIGTDSPLLDQSFFDATLEAFTTYDVVLSKADDGGVVIMANRQPWPAITDLAWSTDTLCSELETACQAHGLSVGHIKAGFDIDTEAELKAAQPLLEQDLRPARKALAQLISRF